jgi:hypothetical protein
MWLYQRVCLGLVVTHDAPAESVGYLPSLALPGLPELPLSTLCGQYSPQAYLNICFSVPRSRESIPRPQLAYFKQVLSPSLCRMYPVLEGHMLRCMK